MAQDLAARPARLEEREQRLGHKSRGKEEENLGTSVRLVSHLQHFQQPRADQLSVSDRLSQHPNAH